MTLVMKRFLDLGQTHVCTRKGRPKTRVTLVSMSKNEGSDPRPPAAPRSRQLTFLLALRIAGESVSASAREEDPGRSRKYTQPSVVVHLSRSKNLFDVPFSLP